MVLLPHCRTRSAAHSRAAGLISQDEFICFIGRYFLLLWWRLHKGGNAASGAGATTSFAVSFGSAQMGGGVANPLSLLGKGVTEGDIIAELVELVVCALDKGEQQFEDTMHREEETPRLPDGTPITLNMPCTLMTGRGGLFRQGCEVQVVAIDPEGRSLIVKLRNGSDTLEMSTNQPFLFRDLAASINFEMLLGLHRQPVAPDHAELEYSRSDPTAGDGCLNQAEMINMFKVLVQEACDAPLRVQLLRDFRADGRYTIIPQPPAGGNLLQEEIYLARCLMTQLLTEDLNEFLRADAVSSTPWACSRHWPCIFISVTLTSAAVAESFSLTFPLPRTTKGRCGT